MANAKHCNLKAAQSRVNRSGLFLAKFVRHMRTNCYFRDSGKIFDTIGGFATLILLLW